MKYKYSKLYWFIKRLDFLRAYNSPFKLLKLKFYCGKIALGTPYFLPRKWVKSKEKPGFLTSVPKKIGFDFVSLGWKTKWTSTDYRFEYSPMISFVFFKWQIAVTFVAPHLDHYWEAWLYYTRETKGSTKERIAQCRKKAPQTWSRTYPNGTKETTDYYNLILKKKWL